MRVLEILFHQDREVPETEQAPVFKHNFSRHATHFNVPERCLQFGQPAGFGDRRTVCRMKPVNGAVNPPPLQMRVGTTYRIRCINITLNAVNLFVRLASGGQPIEWRNIADPTDSR